MLPVLRKKESLNHKNARALAAYEAAGSAHVEDLNNRFAEIMAIENSAEKFMVLQSFYEEEWHEGLAVLKDNIKPRSYDKKEEVGDAITNVGIITAGGGLMMMVFLPPVGLSIGLLTLLGGAFTGTVGSFVREKAEKQKRNAISEISGLVDKFNFDQDMRDLKQKVAGEMNTIIERDFETLIKSPLREEILGRNEVLRNKFNDYARAKTLQELQDSQKTLPSKQDIKELKL